MTAPTTEQVRGAVRRIRKVLEGRAVDVADIGDVWRVDGPDIRTILDALDAKELLDGEFSPAAPSAPASPVPSVTPMVTDEDVERAQRIHSTAKIGNRMRAALEDFASRKGAER